MIFLIAYIDLNRLIYNHCRFIMIFLCFKNVERLLIYGFIIGVCLKRCLGLERNCLNLYSRLGLDRLEFVKLVRFHCIIL